MDIIFNFEKAYFILDELLIGGDVQETSKKSVLKAIAAQDMIQEVQLGAFPRTLSRDLTTSLATSTCMPVS